MKNSLILSLLTISLFVSAQETKWPRYNQVFQLATHNSYWVKRAHAHELFASGTQERLLDQLNFDHARALEIDIHKIGRKPGQWAIYHTAKSKNVLFETLPDFLKQLQQFQYSLPQHEVVTVILELKQILGTNFDKNHTPQDLDKILEEYLGDYLFRPADLMKRCPGSSNLCDCTASSNDVWPTINELRGKFIFVVLGNLHFGPIGHGGLGWATYANSPNPSAFPMSSDFSVFDTKKKGAEKVPEKVLAKAYKASVFQQVEVLNDTAHLKEVSRFIKRGGIVRGADSHSKPEQQKRIEAGFNMLQTDFPWVQYRDGGFSQPFRAKDSTAFTNPNVFAEPGNRIMLSANNESFWSLANKDSVADWETLPSTTRPSPKALFPNLHKPYGKGCLRATSADGKNSVSVCRKVNNRQGATIAIETWINGVFRKKGFTSNDRTSGRVGDLIRLRVERDSTHKVRVKIFSASEMAKNDAHQPQWNLLQSLSFNTDLPKQGIAAAEGDVLFVGTRKNGLPMDSILFLKAQ